MSHERPDVEAPPLSTPDEGEVRARGSARHTHHEEPEETPPETGGYAIWILAAGMLVLALARPRFAALLDDHEAVQAWLTVFVSIALQALPFLVLGVALSAAVAVLVPPEALSRWLPKNPAVAVPVAGLSGMALPGCEYASVPIAGALVSRGIQPAVALTFLLAAPAINTPSCWPRRRSPSPGTGASSSRDSSPRSSPRSSSDASGCAWARTR